MNARQLIALIRTNIARLRAERPESVMVTIASLEMLLADVENYISQHPQEQAATPAQAATFATEYAKLQHASNLAQYDAEAASSRELFKSVIATAKVAIKSLILINGGAAVALLAFIGHLATTETHGPTIHAFAVPLLCFVIGVGTAASLAGFAALGQKLYVEAANRRDDKRKEKKWKRWGNAFVVISFFFGLCSLLSFGIGSRFAYCVFASM